MLAALPLPPHPLVWLTHPPLRLPAGQWQHMMEKVGWGTGTPLCPLLISILVFPIPIHNRVFE